MILISSCYWFITWQTVLLTCTTFTIKNEKNVNICNTKNVKNEQQRRQYYTVTDVLNAFENRAIKFVVCTTFTGFDTTAAT